MKKLVLFAVLGMLMLPAAAQHGRSDDSEFVLRLWNNGMFTVIFDHQVFDAPTDVFRLNRVAPGMHSIVVKQRRGGRYGEVEEILFRGDVRIPRNTKTVATIGKYNRLEILKQVPIGSAGSGYNGANGYAGGHGSHGNNGGSYYGGNGNSGYYAKPILDFPRLEATLLNASFESDRKIIAEQAVSTHSVTAEEIFLIMNMFSFESSKLDFAKFAYPHCVDRQNFYRVNDAFSFSSSIRDLNMFITGYSNRGGNYKYHNY